MANPSNQVQKCGNRPSAVTIKTDATVKAKIISGISGIQGTFADYAALGRRIGQWQTPKRLEFLLGSGLAC